jgi:hypothetical protein
MHFYIFQDHNSINVSKTIEKVRYIYLKYMVLLGLTQAIQCDVWSTPTESNTDRFNAVGLRRQGRKKPMRQLSESWKPVCLNQLGRDTHTRRSPSSRTMLTDKDMTLFSNPELSGNRSPNGTLSLKGMPPEYLAILSTSAQNSSALMKDYAGVSGGMDLFGIRAMFVSPSTTSITSDFGATDLHRFY